MEYSENKMTFHRAKKSLGQNFLHSKGALQAITAAAKLSSADTVLEIGPGKGALTELLLHSGCTVLAVEKDDNLYLILGEKFAQEIRDGKLILIHKDILEFAPEKYGLKNKSYKIVANIPYNITGAIIRMFLESACQPSQMVLLVQKEVAERIVARDGKESLLSLSVKLYGTPRYIAKVPARFFRPIPKVDSAIVSIEDIQRNLDTNEEAMFFRLIHAGFAHKRKMLIGNLSEAFDKSELIQAFSELSLSEKSRAEDISIEKWVALAKFFLKK